MLVNRIHLKFLSSMIKRLFSAKVPPNEATLEMFKSRSGASRFLLLLTSILPSCCDT